MSNQLFNLLLITYNLLLFYLRLCVIFVCNSKVISLIFAACVCLVISNCGRVLILWCCKLKILKKEVFFTLNTTVIYYKLLESDAIKP